MLLFNFLHRQKNKWHLLLIVALLVSMVYQAYRIIPYTPFYPNQVLKMGNDDEAVKKSFSLLVANVYMENREYQRLLDLIVETDPDLILTLETDEKWNDAISAINDRYTYRVEIPLDNTYGMLLHSRLPLSQTAVHYLVQDDIPSIFTKVTLPSGEHFQLYCVHPRPPVPGENDDSKERDAEIVLIGKEAKEVEGPVVVAGDFNDVAWSNTTQLFQEVSSLLDPRIGRGFYNTFNAKYPFLRWPLDHIFHSEDFKLLEISRLKGIGSDHFPIFIRLQLHPLAPILQKVREPDSDTVEDANETIQEGKE